MFLFSFFLLFHCLTSNSVLAQSCWLPLINGSRIWNVDNGRFFNAEGRSVDGTSFLQGTSLNFRCDPGYELVDSSEASTTICDNGEFKPSADDIAQCVESRSALTTRIIMRPQNQRVSKCGQGQMMGNGFKIGGGTEANPGDYPWQALIVPINRFRTLTCGASLIAPNWLLTAAHCVENATDGVVIFLGRHNVSLARTAIDPESVRHRARLSTNIHLHPNYTHLTSTSASLFDYALLYLETGAVEYNDWVQPICLPTREMCDNDQDKMMCDSVHTAGWGLDLDRIETDQCELEFVNAMGRDMPLNDTIHMCGLGELYFDFPFIRRRDTCEGDSGGPLVCRIGPSSYAVGITSFGASSKYIPCGASQTPSVFSRVCGAMPWIEEIVGLDLDQSNWPIPRFDPNSATEGITNPVISKSQFALNVLHFFVKLHKIAFRKMHCSSKNWSRYRCPLQLYPISI